MDQYPTSMRVATSASYSASVSQVALAFHTYFPKNFVIKFYLKKNII